MTPVPRVCADCRPLVLAGMGIVPPRRRRTDEPHRVSLAKPWATGWRDGQFFSTLGATR